MVKPFSNTRFAPGTLVSRLRWRYARAKPVEFSRRANSRRRMRFKVIADKLLTSIIHNNQATAMLMAGYIALRMPGAIGVDIDASGEMQNTERNGTRRWPFPAVGSAKSNP